MEVTGLGIVDPLPDDDDDVLDAGLLAVTSPHQSLGNTVMNYGLSNSESAQQLYQEIFLFQNILRS